MPLMECFVTVTAALGSMDNRQHMHTLQIKVLDCSITPCRLIAILTEPFWLQCVWRTDRYKVIRSSVDILESSPERAIKDTNDGDLICGETKEQISIRNIWIQDMNWRPTNGKAWKTVFIVLITAWLIRRSVKRYAKLRCLAESHLRRPRYLNIHCRQNPKFQAEIYFKTLNWENYIAPSIPLIAVLRTEIRNSVYRLIRNSMSLRHAWHSCLLPMASKLFPLWYNNYITI